MGTHYYFFDRSAVDPLWNLSWQDFLRLHGKSRWAKGPDVSDGAASLRGLIAFSVEPQPSAREIEEIIRRRTLRWTIQHSSPQFYMMEEIVYNVPSLRKFAVSLDVWSNDFAVFGCRSRRRLFSWGRSGVEAQGGAQAALPEV
jgi:hypothetical protein